MTTHQAGEAELKPCPFCGASPEENGDLAHLGECYMKAMLNPGFYPKDAAAEMWNLRTLPPDTELVPKGALEALRGIIEIGKRDMSNPKYDGYFESAREILVRIDAQAKGGG